MEISLSDEVLYDRVYGAWLGRCAGCLLGKPVEGQNKDRVERYLKAAGAYHRVHAINNAALVLLGLLYGEGDFGRTIGISVMGGLDTDCNGATAGSIAGAMLGARALPGKWVDPLNDRIESIVVGFSDCRISDLAKRTDAVARKEMK